MTHDQTNPTTPADNLIRLSEHPDFASTTNDDVARPVAGDVLAIPSASLSTPDARAGEPAAHRHRQHGRARRAVRAARTRLPPTWQHPDTARQAGRQLTGQVVTAPFRYPRAVARGAAVTARAWWSWVRVTDFYEAAKAVDKLADRFDEIHSHRVRRRWWTLGSLAAATGAIVLADLAIGPVTLWVAGGAASVVLAVAGRRKDGSPGRKNVFPGTRTLAWTINGDVLVDAFRAAKIIGPKDGLAFFARPTREGDGWAVVVDLPAGRKASAAIAAREALASALGVDEAQLVLDRVRGPGGHAGRLATWVADTDRWPSRPCARHWKTSRNCPSGTV